MKLSVNDLKTIIESVIGDTEELDETTFQIDSNDPKIQQKVKDIKSNSAIYDNEKDIITVGNGSNKSNAFESTYTKYDILKLMSEAKSRTKKIKASPDDYMTAIKKADRESEYELDGPGWKAKSKPHKNKSKYDRKRMATDDLDEAVYTKKDINKMILEKKYNGKAYTKTELIDLLNNTK